MVEETFKESKSKLQEMYKYNGNQKKEMNSDENNNRNNKKDVILFFSIDIVNSTLYKTINYYGWVDVLNHIFSVLIDKVQADIPEAELWRVLGDEVIFIIKLSNYESLISNINT